MLFPDQTLQLALQHHQAGRFPQAEALYRQILAQQPDHPEALHLLGVLAGQVDHMEDAIGLIRRAIALNPTSPVYHTNLAAFLLRQGKLEESAAAYDEALRLNPNSPEAHASRGNVLLAQRRPDDAIAAYRQALQLKPDYAEAYNNLGNALREKGARAEALAAYQQALRLTPGLAATHSNIGATLRDSGRPEEAVAAYQQAIRLAPQLSEAHFGLANTLCDLARHEDAVAAFRQAIQLAPRDIKIPNNMGTALQDLGRLDEALAAFRETTRLDPAYAQGYFNTANVLLAQRRYDEAVTTYREAIRLHPAFAEAHNNLGSALKEIGLIDEALAACDRAIALDPAHQLGGSNRLFALHLHPAYDAAAILQAHCAWARQHAAPLRADIQPHLNDRTPHRRLRIGYVSPDLRDHVVGRFLEPLLSAHDHNAVEIFCYACHNAHRDSAQTSRLRAHADVWRNVARLTDPQLAELIRADRIDLLVDLAGHTANHRLLVFARRPAPVQLTGLGYPDTTGLATMDYRITDALADPPGLTEHLHTERLLRLPNTAWCFPAPAEEIAVGPPPATAGAITFGSFNNLAKVSAHSLALWTRLLQRVPRSRLLLKNPGLSSAAAQQRIGAIFAAAGITPDRVELRGWAAAPLDHLAAYHDLDIALDTFPYHGTTTTCEALWMGVPVITRAGTAHVSRVGVSLLTAAGLPECIASSDDQFLQIAADLAADLPRLALLRRTLRDRLLSSPLMDAARFAREMETAYRAVWQAWCASAT